MARGLRAWDSPSRRDANARASNEQVGYWHARHSQDNRNKTLKRNLKKAKRQLDFRAQRAKNRSALVEKQGQNLKSQAKTVERQGKQNAAQFKSWAQGWQAAQQRKASDFKAQRDRAYKDYVNKLGKTGGLNKEGQVRLADQRSFKRTWDQRWSAIETRAQADYNARAQAVGAQARSASSNYQSSVSSYNKAAKKQERFYKQYKQSERRYKRAASAYEDNYYPV